MRQQFNQPLDLDVALERICAQMQPTSRVEQVPLAAALGRVLATPVTSPIALPPFDNSAMDGYAVSDTPEDDLKQRRYTLIGTSAAGHPFDGEVREGQCVRIFTGAAIPAGARRVVLQEDTDADGTIITVSGAPDPRSNIRPQGHDVVEGELLDEAGTQVDAFRVGRYAASGVAQVQVHEQPVVGIFSTGDELMPLEARELPPGAIYESNRHALAALLDTLPVQVRDLGNLLDSPEAVRDAIKAASQTCDVVITSGGVSVGEHDHVKGAVEQLGTLDFWRLNLKPGKPLAFGRVGDAWFFGLPGNPVSTIVTWLLIAKPAIMNLCGANLSPKVRLTARLTSPLHHSPGRAEYQRGFYRASEEGPTLDVEVNGHQASNRLTSFASANCLIEVPSECGDVEAGQLVQIIPLASL